MSESIPVQYTGSFYVPFMENGRTKFKFYIDNHRVVTYTTCPTLFNYTQMQNYRAKAIGAAMNIGGWWSRTMELLYREMSFGRFPSLEEAVTFASDAWAEFNMEKTLRPDHYKSFGGSMGALRMIGDYYNKLAANDFSNWKVIGTESGFGLKDEVLVGEDDEVIVYLTGKPDLMLYEQSSGQFMIGDHKTVDYVKNNTIISFKPHTQTAGYVYAAKKIAKALGIEAKSVTDRCCINVCARKPPAEKPKDGVPKPRFLRVYPNYTEAELEEWRLELLEKCRQIKHSIESDTFIRHQNSCHIYGGCSFRRVCSLAPGARHISLKADFVQVDPWSPYDPEEQGEGSE